MVAMQDSTRGSLEDLLDVAIKITGADMGNMQILDEHDDLRIVVHSGFDRPFLKFFERIHPEERGASCGHAKSIRERVVVEDVTKSPIFVGTPSLKVLLESGVRACQSTPLITGSGELVGVVSTHYRGRAYSPSGGELRTLDRLTLRAADLIRRMGDFQRLEDPRSFPLPRGKRGEVRARILKHLVLGVKVNFSELLVLSGVGRSDLTLELEAMISEGTVTRTSDGFVTLYSRES
jgi:GAF domain-containing protein